VVIVRWGERERGREGGYTPSANIDSVDLLSADSGVHVVGEAYGSLGRVGHRMQGAALFLGREATHRSRRGLRRHGTKAKYTDMKQGRAQKGLLVAIRVRSLPCSPHNRKGASGEKA